MRAGQALKRSISYHWDPNDRLRMVVDALKGPTHYTHDAMGNLVRANYADGSVELRMPDAVGNLFRTEDCTGRTYGAAGELLEVETARGVIRYSYDPEGNRIGKVEPDGRRWRYEYNPAGMMSAVVRPDGSRVEMRYDALGRRTQKRFRGQTTHWVWDGNNPLHEWVEGELRELPEPETTPLWQADPAIKKREAELSEHLSQGPPQRGSKDAPITWLFEPESFAPMARLQGSAAASIVTDHLGTPVGMYDADGTQQWAASISVWGEPRDFEGPEQDGDGDNGAGSRDDERGTHAERLAVPFRWPGQYEDAETGLHYNRFRYYDPEAGQYTQQDPIGLEGGLAPYGYVRDNLTWSDPLGLKSCAERQQAMLDKNVGYNVSPEEWFQNYSHLGRHGTFVTDKKAFSGVIGHARPGKYTVGRRSGKGRVSRKQARDLERNLGLEPGSLNSGFRITKVEGIRDMSPRSPLEGNRFLRGPGKGLPGGGPEMVVDPLPT